MGALGTADKVQAFQAMKTAQDTKTAMAGYDTAIQHMHDIGQQMNARQADMNAKQAEVNANNKFNDLYQAAVAVATTRLRPPTCRGLPLPPA